MPKIRVNQAVRELLVELDTHMQRYHSLTAQLSDPATATNFAIDAGAERQHITTVILGCAYRLNKASRGEC